MSLKEKILLIILVLVFTAVFSGCGQKASENSVPVNKSSVPAPAEEEMPKPTGKIDDVVNAVMEDVDAETAEISKEENEAQSLIDDSQEADNFGQSYDENEF